MRSKHIVMHQCLATLSNCTVSCPCCFKFTDTLFTVYLLPVPVSVSCGL